MWYTVSVLILSSIFAWSAFADFKVRKFARFFINAAVACVMLWTFGYRAYTGQHNVTYPSVAWFEVGEIQFIPLDQVGLLQLFWIVISIAVVASVLKAVITYRDKG